MTGLLLALYVWLGLSPLWGHIFAAWCWRRRHPRRRPVHPAYVHPAYRTERIPA